MAALAASGNVPLSACGAGCDVSPLRAIDWLPCDSFATGAIDLSGSGAGCDVSPLRAIDWLPCGSLATGAVEPSACGAGCDVSPLRAIDWLPCNSFATGAVDRPAAARVATSPASGDRLASLRLIRHGCSRTVRLRRGLRRLPASGDRLASLQLTRHRRRQLRVLGYLRRRLRRYFPSVLQWGDHAVLRVLSHHDRGPREREHDAERDRKRSAGMRIGRRNNLRKIGRSAGWPGRGQMLENRRRRRSRRAPQQGRRWRAFSE